MKEPYYVYHKSDHDEIEIKILDMAEYKNAKYILYKEWNPFLQEQDLETGILRIWLKRDEIEKVMPVDDALLYELTELFKNRREYNRNQGECS